ncbi:desmethyl-deoxy-podophyllotoxin synthase-like [Cornus florida]|uniref:desmethyl-deoxy-podophyllotoxin synthase-like n=1 Tax=Cornus florida TaxID=4283 RepID=UPI0028A0A919|nr:desmethyl-deoxy-podophyllotoxin synthase-like [Cornus florida]XP_059666539.1 desmethyl-deoxy-podophyllotoxin synthase-like [Cornus florida]
MELPWPSIPILFTFLLFLFMVMKIVSKNKRLSPNLPPGPWKLPLIGNMHQLVGYDLTHRRLRDLAVKHGPVMHLQLGQLSIIVISSAETAKEVMKTHDIIFANRPYLLAASILSYDFTGMFFAPYGDYWRQLRKICIMELLSIQRVQSFRPIREEEISNLIKSISTQTGSLLNLSKEVFTSTNDITARAAFGKKCRDQEEFISLIKVVIELGGGFNVADLFPSVKLLALISGLRPKLEKLHRKLDGILDRIIDEHKAKKAATKTTTIKDEADEDLVDVLLRVQEHGDLEFPITINNIKSVILDVFSAGSETSSTTVEWAMSAMLKNPSVMQKAQAEVRNVVRKKGNSTTVDEVDLHELNYLKLVIKETLRLHTTVPLLVPRESTDRCEIKGYEIPVKSKVIVNAWAICRDPEQWTDPESFNPERFLDSPIDYKGAHFQYTPFGAGRRICPGILFAQANIELQLAQLLYHFDWKLPDGTKHGDLDMTEVFGITVRRKRDLCVIPIAYHSSSTAE